MNAQPNTKFQVRIFYPADPVGTIPGGIDTFIRGILKWAPEDIDVSLVGVSTDPETRPPGRWRVCNLGRRTFRFFPVAALNNPGRRQRIPLSVTFTFGLLRHWMAVSRDYDVAEFHRIEPSVLFLADRRPKNAFFHQNMAVLRNTKADIRWRYLPGLYFFLEDRLVPRLAGAFCVKEDAVTAYRERYPQVGGRFRFIPTWMDPDIFHPVADTERRPLRRAISAELELNPDSPWLVTVGRLDHQKDPHLLLDGLVAAKARCPGLKLVFVGDGVLRDELVQRVASQGLKDSVRFAGLRPAQEVARLLQAADLFILSSAYEGMPMCVLEALGTGLPVVSTDVGEVGRAVKSGVNGSVVAERTGEALADGIAACLARLESLSGKPCTDSVAEYVPERVLAPVFQSYRAMASGRISA